MQIIPNEERVKQHHMVVCDFNADILCVWGNTSSRRFRTWTFRNPATAGQFQVTFKVKTMTGVAAVSTVAGADTDT